MKRILILLSFIFILSCRCEAKDDSLAVSFSLRSENARSVSLAGSFNQWRPENYRLVKNDSLWTINVKLAPGYYYYKFVVDGQWIPDPANPLKINDGGNSFNSIVKAGTPPVPLRKKSSKRLPENQLPRPVLESNPDLVTLYYAAWEMAWNKIASGTQDNGFSEQYMDEGFNEQIFQWDTCFMVLFGMYAPGLFPAMASLDNFYRKQEPDGYIQRVYLESDGKKTVLPSKEEPMINPPLFAWIELRYYELTGDSSRLKRVLPVLIKYFNWIDNNCRSLNGSGLYYTTQLGSGMDNIPRPNTEQAAWIDFSSQQALAAESIARIAEITGDTKNAKIFREYYSSITQRINKYCWSEKDKFYFDNTRSDTLCNTKHIGAFWTLIAGVADSTRAKSLVSHLRNPAEFWRPRLIPALSADHPDYSPAGHYWRGGIWAPTNYITIKGLEKAGYDKLADAISINYIKNINNIYWNFTPSLDSVAFEERYQDQYHTIWECYSPESSKPATRWDNTFYSRQDFVGWSGLGPVSLLIENILGIKVKGSENTISWRIHRSDTHGIENLWLRDQRVTLIASPGREGTSIKIEYQKPFILELNYSGETFHYSIPINASAAKNGQKNSTSIILGILSSGENK